MDLLQAVNTYTYQVSLGELRLMNKHILKSDINYNTLKYLDLITLTENCTVTKLASLLQISKPAVTMKINEMLQEGLVIKRQSSEDKRVYFLEVCAESAEEYRIYDDKLFKAAAAAKEKYSQAEIDSFCTILLDLASYFSWEDET